jgi:DNA-binding beta-propeller fold protein YncE
MFGTIGDIPGQFQRPKGIAIDRHDNVYVVDNVFNNVQVFDKKNDLLLVWGQAGYKPGEVVNPMDICIDDKDRIYLVSQVGLRVNVYQLLPDPSGGKEGKTEEKKR